MVLPAGQKANWSTIDKSGVQVLTIVEQNQKVEWQMQVYNQRD